MFIAALFIIDKIWKKKKKLMCLPTDEWRCYTHIHTHDGILFNHELEEYPVICNGWPFKTLC